MRVSSILNILSYNNNKMLLNRTFKGLVLALLLCCTSKQVFMRSNTMGLIIIENLRAKDDFIKRYAIRAPP